MAQKARVLRQIVAMFEKQGCVVTNGANGYRVKCPDGGIITLHITPRDNDDQLNQLRQQAHRHKLEWNL